ncbi:DUF4133 domain-containing protein [Foetidibacter luteolus]|uniref:DUF4133 domain-containing protein n=1 Tax=Foetidibacter luteolus TaxID=2608880 RepID=UPI00129BB34E|nr:DUF4133 domain-containing protein [Foetidibacter luteolus]
MANSIYQINKGVGQPIVFKGLQAQYIWYLGGGLVGTMILFAFLYICGVNAFVCVAIALITGGMICHCVLKMSKTYGEHGLMKKMAASKIPRLIKSKSRKVWKG